MDKSGKKALAYRSKGSFLAMENILTFFWELLSAFTLILFLQPASHFAGVCFQSDAARCASYSVAQEVVSKNKDC